jgi:hypothetical protein
LTFWESIAMHLPVRFKCHCHALSLPLSLLILSAAAAAGAQAQDSGWRDRDGRAVANSAAMKSEAGFSASLLVTADADWQQKWNTPAQTTPSFKKAEVVRYGEKVTVLIFFANPKVDAQGGVKVRCDIKVTQPGGVVSSNQTGLPCFEGILGGAPTNIYLSQQRLEFLGDATDPVGKWVIDVTVHDEHRPLGVALQTGFELKP